MAYRKGTYCKCNRCKLRGHITIHPLGECIVRLKNISDWIRHGKYQIERIIFPEDTICTESVDKKYIKKLSKIELAIYGIEECI